VQALAAWLVARPQNAVLGLAATLLLPVPPQLTSGVIMVLLVLAQGVRLAVTEALAAATLLVVVTLVFNAPVALVVELMATTWLPSVLLAVLLIRTRSLALTMQVTVILAVVAMVGFYLVVTDPVAFWEPLLASMEKLVLESGLELNTELLTAEIMTLSATFAFWLLFIAALLLGYGLCNKLPDKAGLYGWFRDLSFGRVIASMMAIASLLALIVDAAWLQNIAFILFVVFWVQGLAIVHWLHAQQILPLGAVVAIYVLLPLLQVLLLTGLGILGYMDAWFDFRRRMKKA
jgi:hypothetical protein